MSLWVGWLVLVGGGLRLLQGNKQKNKLVKAEAAQSKPKSKASPARRKPGGRKQDIYGVLPS